MFLKHGMCISIRPVIIVEKPASTFQLAKKMRVGPRAAEKGGGEQTPWGPGDGPSGV